MLRLPVSVKSIPKNFKWPIPPKILGVKKCKVPVVLFFVFCATLLTYLYWGLPLPTQLTSEAKNPVSTQILDRNGKLIYEIFEEKRRTPVKLEELPKYVSQATIAIEDKDFYKHHGFSPWGMSRALYNIITKRDLQGGSTITQQLVKTTLLSPERTIRRKIREFTLSLIVETIYGKDKILEMYLNNVPYGGTAWGIEAAAQAYFGKPAKELTLAQAALLAGLPQAPTRFSPFGTNPQLSLERQRAVLRRMAEDSYITEEQRQQAEKEEFVFAKQQGIKAPHFSLYVKEQLVEKLGQHIVERGGLRVKTTLDLDLQEEAEGIVKEEIEKLKKANVGNGAVVVTNPKTGEIYAMVGSKDYFALDEDGKVNVTIRPRQPGSSIKPLNYALAIETGKITASTPLADVPTCFAVAGQPLYCPVNYDGSFHGAVQARFSLGNSYNIPAVRTLSLNGLDEFVEFARKMGLTTIEDSSRYGLSLTLGGGEVRMIDMAEAFGVFATGGIRQDLVSILEVKDWKGNVIETTEIQEGDRALSAGTSYIISHILLDNNARSQAFGESSYLNVSGHPEVAVKTGTTNDKRDNWTIGYTPEVVAAVWVGNNDNTPMSAVASGVTGASPIWNRIVKTALNKIEAGEQGSHTWPTKPSEVVGTNVCATTGTLPSGSEEDPGCPIRFEFFLEDFPPPPPVALTQSMSTFKDTGIIAPEDVMPDQVDTRDHPVIYDPLGTRVCLDCPLPDWAVTIK
ncbi:MAG: penicillin-binding protein [Candidatus Blackburnbacteria bacterium]|nr:penicillin-binding protein [Candidatus Blackburnbacteria bacterium]